MKKRSRFIVIGTLVGLLLLAVVPVGAGPGDPVLAGRFNQVDRRTVLTGAAADKPMLKIVNTAPDGTGIRIKVAAGQPPLSVNSSARVKHLNADRLDGFTSADLIPGGTLPAGTTLRGTFGMGASAGTVGDLAMTEISFGYTLAAAPATHFIEVGETPPAECPGSSTSPQAAPGHLCIYEAESLGAAVRDTNGDAGDGSSYSFGARLFVRSATAGDFYSMGTWAATAAAVGAEDLSLLPSGFTLGVAD